MISDVNQILSVNESGIPMFLKEKPYWINWKPIIEDSKVRKVPSHGNKVLHGQYWDNEGLSFEEALGLIPHCGGLALLVSMHNALSCIDIDNCCSTDDVRLRKILELAPDAWCELSPSGNGVHVWGKLPDKPSYLLEGRKTIGYCGKEFEWYGSGRGITVTGHRVSGNSLVDLTKAVQYCDSFRPKIAKRVHVVMPIATSIDTILHKAFEKEPELQRMYIEGHRWDDKSAEDFHFCQRMWFWLGGHGSHAIENAFKNSALYRESKGPSYVARTVNNAGKGWNGKYYGKDFSR